MGVFNWILFKSSCPNCGNETHLKCQTHMASSIDGNNGDSFYDKQYHLNERMRWWSKYNPRYEEWKQGNLIDRDQMSEDEDVECCYLNCDRCNAELYAVIKFKDCTPVEIVKIGLEKEWPDNFYR